MTQPRKHSWLEASCNTASGFVVSYLVGLVVYPMLGWHISQLQNAQVVGVFTVISIVRSYAWRRAFNWWQHHRSQV